MMTAGYAGSCSSMGPAVQGDGPEGLCRCRICHENYIDSLDTARALVQKQKIDALRVIYGNVPDTLSQLIRTAFIPGDGYTFAVADFSAIEARVIAWLAGEEWRLDVFRTHGKIYEASASTMFGVPIEK